MAGRFGAQSAARGASANVKYLIAGISLLIVFLIVIAVVIATQSPGENSTATAAVVAPEVAATPAPASVSVLMAATRIEEGQRVEAYMFNPVPMQPDKVAANAYKAEDLQSIVGKYAVRLINANMPVLREDLADTRPISSFNIPPGYRAVTILVDARSGVEGFAKPNSRVDVLWTYSEAGKQKVATIARFIKVLSVGGSVQADAQRVNVPSGKDQNTTVTILVTEKEARKIELARTLGTLNLSLVGDAEVHNTVNEPDAVSIEDLVGRPAVEPAVAQEETNDGVMYTTDPRTGRQLRYVLRKGRWSLDRTFGGTEGN